MNELFFYTEVASLPLFYRDFTNINRKVREGMKEAKMEKPYWEGKEFSFFSHKKCEYFPCHKGADPEEFNCLFCYCPLYALGKDCGGNFTYTENGYKDCTNCLVPHKRKNYGYITGKYQELAKRIAKMDEK